MKIMACLIDNYHHENSITSQGRTLLFAKLGSGDKVALGW